MIRWVLHREPSGYTGGAGCGSLESRLQVRVSRGKFVVALTTTNFPRDSRASSALQIAVGPGPAGTHWDDILHGCR
jgi:hypothetical protein